MSTRKTLVNQPQEETKFKILDAAAKTFGEYGYHQATMTKIAEEAGVAKGTVYWYFAGKEDLFLGLLENGLVRLYSRLNLVLTGQDQPMVKLRRFILEYLHFYGGQSHLGKIVSQGGIQGLSTEFHQKMFDWQEKFHHVNAELIGQGVQVGVFRGDLQIRQMAKVFAGVIAAIGSEQLFGSGEIDKEVQTEFILTLFLEGIGAKRS